MFPRGGAEDHLLNGHVHPDLRIAEVSEVVHRIARPLVRDQRLHAFTALAPGIEQFRTSGAEADVELLIAVCHADIAVLRMAKRAP